ncbi:uncharacterized protein LOC126987617 isoform X2 [Eriocheir sinensis]|uniref:uncharacterized protein LOC126987617 isoform X2 n=1 Tax=Eriocheir sinensis TaxID=95602 RepID=UPI0021C6799E|nr:uncharacterized protein LOC126987617 isoform X2 [Eriocheir sinensis]
MIAAIARVLLFSVLSSSVHLSLALLYHVFLASSVVQTLDLKGTNTAPDLIRALPADLSPSGCVGHPGYTFSPSVPSLFPSVSSPLPPSFPVLTSAPSVLTNLQMLRVTHVPPTQAPSEAPLPYNPTSSAASHYASEGVQAPFIRGGELEAQSNDNSLFRPHLLPATPPSRGPVLSRLAAGSGRSIGTDTTLLYRRESVTPTEAPGVGSKAGDNDLHRIISSGLNTRTEKEPSRGLQARVSGGVSVELKQNFLNSGRLLSGTESDNSQRSQEVIRSKNSLKGGQTKVLRHILSLKLRGRCQLNQSPAECTERKTRFALESRVQETQGTYMKIREETRVPEAPNHNEERGERQRGGFLSLGGTGKAQRMGRSGERRILHLASLALARGQEDEERTSEGTQGNYEHETTLGQERYERTTKNLHEGRLLKMFVSLTDSRAPSNTVDRRREQTHSSSSSSSPSSSSGSPQQEDNEKWPKENEIKYQARKREGKRERLLETRSAGGVTGGEARLPETKQRHQYEDSPDSSIHVLHVSPFIADLILNDNGDPQIPYLGELPDSTPSGDPVSPGDHPLQANDLGTSTPVSFTSPARLRVITEDLDDGDGGVGDWGRQREADDQSWLTSEARARAPGEQNSERDLLLNARPFKTESDNESQAQFYETNTNVSEVEVHEQQPSLPLLSLSGDTRAGGGRKVKQGDTNKSSATTKRRATTRAPDIPLLDTEGSVRIPCYVIIFLLGVIGNTLVIVTLLQNRKMRTITNVFLLNLAFSDLLLGVFCMPFTLVGSLLRDFIFGAVMCRLIPYFQAVSVSVSVWTLVAISLERFYAICQPLKSRGWQTLSHAYKIISLVWLLSLVFMAPIAVLSQLLPVGDTSRHKCREMWPSLHFERGFSMFLGAALLLVPLIIMVAAYSSITVSLWHGMRLERETGQVISLTDLNGLVMVQQSLRRKQSRRHVSKISIRFRKIPAQRPCVHCGQPESESESGLNPTSPAGQSHSHACLHERDCENNKWRVESVRENSVGGVSGRRQHALGADYGAGIPSPCGRRPTKPDFKRLRSTHLEKSIEAKKHVIRMLFVVVLEFFLCWTPIFVVNIMCLYIPEQVYRTLGSVGISFMHLLSYASSCCNPITYCFMNKKFLQGFRHAFGCRKEAERIGRKNATAASFRSQSNNIFKLATEVKRDARETTV